MPAKPNARNWNDVQTAIATVAIVTTLGLWNLFSTPSKAEAAQSTDLSFIPPTEPPVEESVPAVVGMPQVKILFTQTAPQTTVVQQTQEKKKKKNKNNNDNGGGGGSVTQTQSS